MVTFKTSPEALVILIFFIIFFFRRRERSLGEYEGQIRSYQLINHSIEFRPPGGGESVSDQFSRVEAALHRLHALAAGADAHPPIRNILVRLLRSMPCEKSCL